MEKTSIKKRQKARTLVMQALYQWSMTHASAEEIELQFRMMNTPGAFDDAYFTMLLHGIMRDIDSIEKQFVEFLDRPLDELNPVERAVLRLGTYELMHRIDIPYKVVLDESVSLTKKFGSQDGHRYVNGVLHQVANILRATEKTHE